MKKSAFIFISLFHCLNSLSAQVSYREFFWALWHPVAAIKVKINDKKCDAVFDTINKARLDNFSNGGKLDAFRHVFYMASFSQKVKVKKLRKLGEAHEKTNYRQFKRSKTEHGEIPDSLSSVMDLYNNEVGFRIGSANRGLSLLQLKEEVILQINSGGTYMMKRNAKGKYLDCDGNEIIGNEKKWSINKCLVRTNNH